MITYRVHKASPLRDAEVDEAQIVIDLSIDDALDSDDRPRDLFVKDGETIAEALWNHLPGGTIDQVIANLLAKRASSFRVPFRKAEVTA